MNKQYEASVHMTGVTMSQFVETEDEIVTFVKHAIKYLMPGETIKIELVDSETHK